AVGLRVRRRGAGRGWIGGRRGVGGVAGWRRVGGFGGRGGRSVGGGVGVVFGVDASEYEAAGAGLEGAGDGEVDVVADARGAVVGDDHGSVVEVADALAGLLAALDEADTEGLAGD